MLLCLMCHSQETGSSWTRMRAVLEWAVLNVIQNDQVLPVAFYSKQLRGPELHYSITDKESLAIVKSIEHFLGYIYGRLFSIFTDHKPCTSLISSTHLTCSFQGMVLKLQGFDVSIIYRKGEDNAMQTPSHNRTGRSFPPGNPKMPHSAERLGGG